MVLRGLAVVGLLGHLAMGFMFLVSGLVAPWYGVLLLGACWAGLAVLAWRLWPRRPGWILAIPALDVAIWFAVLSTGEALFGWTA